MFTAIARMVAGPIVGEIVDGIFGVIERYQRKEITKIEADAEIKKVVQTQWAKVEEAWANATASMFGSLMQGASKSKIIAVGWVVTLFSQLAVLLWHQVGIPFYVWYASTPDHTAVWPSSGTTVEWAYLLVALLLGGGALMLKGKPPKL